VLLIVVGIAGAVVDPGSVVTLAVVLAALGVGWNFGVVGGSTLLATSVPRAMRPHVEGIGEVAMSVAAAAGAPLAGIVVALGSFSALSMAVAVAATLALGFTRWPARGYGG
ncbi:MAG: MFS transporter, partial [Chloroflexia bacterium]|nr:MFS transporter [Chloroflexia bacterium]